jgi:hypothetical protein
VHVGEKKFAARAARRITLHGGVCCKSATYIMQQHLTFFSKVLMRDVRMQVK